MSTDMETYKDRVEAFFHVLDGSEYSILGDLLGEEFVYEFADTKVSGRTRMEEYLRTNRTITDTDHEISQLLVDGSTCACEGRVTGQSTDGDQINTRFVDVFEFDTDTDRLRRVAVYTR